MISVGFVLGVFRGGGGGSERIEVVKLTVDAGGRWRGSKAVLIMKDARMV